MWTRKSIIDFDLPSVEMTGIFHEVILSLKLVDTDRNFSITVSRLREIEWLEQTITWNNFKPSILQRGMKRISGGVADEGKVLQVDVSDLIQPSSKQQKVTLFLEGLTSANAIFTKTITPPQLHIRY